MSKCCDQTILEEILDKLCQLVEGVSPGDTTVVIPYCDESDDFAGNLVYTVDDEDNVTQKFIDVDGNVFDNPPEGTAPCDESNEICACIDQLRQFFEDLECPDNPLPVSMCSLSNGGVFEACIANETMFVGWIFNHVTQMFSYVDPVTNAPIQADLVEPCCKNPYTFCMEYC